MAVTSKVTPQKQAVVAELKEQMTSAKGVVITGYRGLTVAQDTQLRRELREAGVTYHVVKNT
ncbi:MAG: 50S ribosomal protein L10, partial [Selenomonadaceae bacterium]|nr:50S ribosomal protein L10 [Selenomonadaceae bacterium]